ncbi:MAG: hypothetical protein JJ863_21400 [Deltaproteobacteria bacterium]|nr:hypothetical protein [Deltaproteobacteria bacterium]
MATKKSEKQTADEGSEVTSAGPEEAKDGTDRGKARIRAEVAEGQRAAAVKQYDEARKAKAKARAEAADLKVEAKYEGPTIEVRTAPGPNGERRPRYVKGGQKWSDKPRKVHLEALTREQYRAIMVAPLLEVRGKAPADFDGFRKD